MGQSYQREVIYPLLLFTFFRVYFGLLKARRLASMVNEFTAVFQKDGDWWLGFVEELPGANTQGATLEEARENLKEAVALVIEVNRSLSESDIAGREVIREQLVITR